MRKPHPPHVSPDGRLVAQAAYSVKRGCAIKASDLEGGEKLQGLCLLAPCDIQRGDRIVADGPDRVKVYRPGARGLERIDGEVRRTEVLEDVASAAR